jgi:hypothetical protein
MKAEKSSPDWSTIRRRYEGEPCSIRALAREHETTERLRWTRPVLNKSNCCDRNQFDAGLKEQDASQVRSSERGAYILGSAEHSLNHKQLLFRHSGSKFRRWRRRQFWQRRLRNSERYRHCDINRNRRSARNNSGHQRRSNADGILDRAANDHRGMRREGGAVTAINIIRQLHARRGLA